MKRYTIAVDFDGVIHSYTSPWTTAEDIPDPPVPGAIDWLREMVQHFKVVIFTTRGKTIDGARAVLQWIFQHSDVELISNLTVMSEKPPALIYIDDRAWRFEGRWPTEQEIHDAKPWNKKE